MNYVEFFGFSHEPFALGPSVRGFYNSASHNAILRELAQPAGESALFILRGARGSGRTTVALQFLDQLSPELYGRVFVDAAVVDAALTAAIRVQCGVSAEGSIADLFHEDGFDQLAIVIDHADRCDLQELHAAVPAGIVLAIVEEGFDASSLPDAKVLDLEPLNARGTGKYIQDRLVRAGGRRDLFSSAVLSRVFELSGGNPARINQLCTALLVGAANAGSESVGDAFLALLPEMQPSADVEEAMEHLDEATMDLAAGELAVDEETPAEALQDTETDLGAGLEMEEAGGEPMEAVSAADADAMSDEHAGGDATDESAASVDQDVDLDALMAELDGGEASQGSLDVTAEEDAAALELEIEQQIGDAAATSDEDELALDELIGAAESGEGEDLASSGVDDLLGELDAAIQMPDEEAAGGPDEDVDLDAMLGELDAGVEEVEEDVAASAEEDVDLDAMLNDLDASEAAMQDEGGSGVADEDVDLDALMADLDDRDESAAEAPGEDVDLDALMADLEGGQDVASGGEDEDVDIDSLLGELEINDAGAGSDELLGLEDEVAQSSGADDDIDALLDELDSREDKKAASDDDDLDDLLSQIDKLQDS